MSVTATHRDPLDLLTRCCSRCGVTKTWREFPVRSRWENGTVRTVLSACRSCQNLLNLDWQARNRERRSAYEKARRRRVRVKPQVLLDAGPLRAFLAGDGRDQEVLAEVSGVSERTIRALVRGERGLVQLATADRLVTRLGGVLELVYPYEDAA